MSTVTIENDIINAIASGHGITLIELARQHSVDPSTVFRWVLKGLPGGAGGRIRLAAVKRGKRWLTCPVAVARFFAALPASTPTPTAPPIRTPSRRQKDSNRAKKALNAKYGI